mmetsp:Transcript_1376/g.4893  ORF Transcript_1376/g.4893 Transcript_1376/m.4893 type:complete len:81 (-) Transcript_1376:582-824(-)
MSSCASLGFGSLASLEPQLWKSRRTVALASASFMWAQGKIFSDGDSLQHQEEARDMLTFAHDVEVCFTWQVEPRHLSLSV